MNASQTVSASFSNVTFISRISYSGPPSPTLFWYKCNSGDIVNNTIYNYATHTYNSLTGNPSMDTTNYKTGTSSLIVNPNFEHTQYIIPPFINFGNYSGNTFSMWFRGTNPYAGDRLQTLACFSATSSWFQAEFIRLGNGFSGIWGLDVGGIDSSNNPIEMSKNTANNQILADSTWHHVAWVFGNISQHLVYIDGALFYTYTASPFTYYCNGGSTRLFGNWSYNECFCGNVYDVRLYNYVLSAKQVLSIYTNPNT